ncbi:zinc finger CCCH domain-containing protein 13-like isoform X2 [Macadamia integrifolia]|uniref:zinc finger CCCH domain-containing protein 13-like isoform X2 n=1 Tax=Macadamia integrifolia TaxID=60698 RepID=UPI001C4EEAF8|nr:zinc finger CCCH domain-containing protein 13-like isoform X2 [Macadamia integrifolia]
MSRCFPYPPPGYERKNGALDEALINSIKKEREKAKKENRKEKKREKKEKERGREKARENGGVEDKKQIHEKKHKRENGKVEHGVGDHRQRKEEEAEQLEKSSLTEEQGQPISSQNLYDSIDSTQNSHKRKKHSSPSDSSHNNHGSIFRIRLKQRDQEIFPSKELGQPNSGRTDHILQGKNEIHPRLGEDKHCSTSGRQQPCSSSGRTSLAMQECLKQKDQEILRTKKLSHSNLGKTGPNSLGKYEICPKVTVQHCPTSVRTSTVQDSLKQKDQGILSTKKLPQSNLEKIRPNSQVKHEICPKITEVQRCTTAVRTSIVQDSLKQKDQERLSTKKLPQSNLEKIRPNLPVKQEICPKITEVQHCPTSVGRYENDPRPSEELTCSTSGRTGVQSLEIAESSRKTSSKLKKIESLYRDLIENWVPPPIENIGNDFDDQEWLFDTGSKSEPEPKRFKPSNEGVCQGSTSIWPPRAYYFSEADIYALPYTVPF